jgi:hypothetical protein
MFPKRERPEGRPEKGRGANAGQFAVALLREQVADFIDEARANLQEAGQPEDAVVVLRMVEDAPGGTISVQPWIGPKARIQRIVPDVSAAIMAEIGAITGAEVPVLIWSVFKDGRPPSAKVFRIDRVDEP